MSDLIVLGVILFALNRLDKIDGESYERNRTAYETVDTFAEHRDCNRRCENIPQSLDIVCQNRVSNDREHREHSTAIQTSPEKP